MLRAYDLPEAPKARRGFRLPGFALVCLTWACGWLGDVANAQIRLADYDALAAELNARLDFEDRPAHPEPGILLDCPAAGRGIQICQHFVGQIRILHTDPTSPRSGPHHAVSAVPVPAPLRLAPRAAGLGLVVAAHRGFGSNAVFPLGPDGQTKASGRGEGALSILFASDQTAFGLRVHSDYPDPLGTRPPPGLVAIVFFDRAGRVLSQGSFQLDTGTTDLGFRSDAGRASVAGMTLTNTDPGGIAIDDIVYQAEDLSG